MVRKEEEVAEAERRVRHRESVFLTRERMHACVQPSAPVANGRGLTSACGAVRAVRVKGLEEVARCEVLLVDMEAALSTLTAEVRMLTYACVC